jgi:ureidoglycolate hydrolase
MTVHESLLEIRQYEGIGYQPIIDYGAWRVAILRYHPELEPQAINSMQRHDETDEVFVLLAGRCILFLGDGNADIGALHAVDMQPLQAYNVKKGAWHSHTLSRDAVVLIVENRDTSSVNSPTRPIQPDHTAWLTAETERLWSGIAQP